MVNLHIQKPKPQTSVKNKIEKIHKLFDVYNTICIHCNSPHIHISFAVHAVVYTCALSLRIFTVVYICAVPLRIFAECPNALPLRIFAVVYTFDLPLRILAVVYTYTLHSLYTFSDSEGTEGPSYSTAVGFSY